MHSLLNSQLKMTSMTDHSDKTWSKALRVITLMDLGFLILIMVLMDITLMDITLMDITLMVHTDQAVLTVWQVKLKASTCSSVQLMM